MSERGRRGLQRGQPEFGKFFRRGDALVVPAALLVIGGQHLVQLHRHTGAGAGFMGIFQQPLGQ